MWTKLLTVVETALFRRQAASIWSEAELLEFVDFIAKNPEAGDVVPDTGGARKVRWSRQGGGKRGGVRVIYFTMNPDVPLYLLMIYAKGRRENLSSEDKQALRGIAAEFKRTFRRH